MFRLRPIAFAAVFSSLATFAHAGPVADFEASLRNAYGDYRVALFQTNAGNQERAVSAIDGFRKKWIELDTVYADPPPQYADDPNYSSTIDTVLAVADRASGEVAEGNLAEAHETLEAIRDEIGNLHQRNGIITFSDRMNAYHAKMEEVLSTEYAGPSGLADLCEDAAVLGYLAADLGTYPPPGETGSDYQTLLDAVMASVAGLREAARAGDTEAANRAVGQLKMPYAKLFLQFG